MQLPRCAVQHSLMVLGACGHSGLGAQDLTPMSLGLSHSLSRYKLKFSPDKVQAPVEPWFQQLACCMAKQHSKYGYVLAVSASEAHHVRGVVHTASFPLHRTGRELRVR